MGRRRRARRVGGERAAASWSGTELAMVDRLGFQAAVVQGLQAADPASNVFEAGAELFRGRTLEAHPQWEQIVGRSALLIDCDGAQHSSLIPRPHQLGTEVGCGCPTGRGHDSVVSSVSGPSLGISGSEGSDRQLPPPGPRRTVLVLTGSAPVRPTRRATGPVPRFWALPTRHRSATTGEHPRLAAPASVVDCGLPELVHITVVWPKRNAAFGDEVWTATIPSSDNAPIQWSQEWLRKKIGERAQLTNDARWSFRKRPCGSSDRRRSTKSEKCGYSFASRSASMQCSFPQCARPLNAIKEESTSLRYRQ